MIRLGILGAGTIFQSYVSALSHLSDRYKLVSVCDADTVPLLHAKKSIVDAGTFSHVQYTACLTEFLAHDIDTVLIATPPETHFSLALDCLRRGKNVLMEKPAVLSLEELELLYTQADRTSSLLHVAYHASFAIDLLWYMEQRDVLAEQYGLKQISKIYCGFYDPYIQNGILLHGKEKLAGSYIDSGVNQLSVCNRLTDLNGFRCINHHILRSNDIAVASNSVFSNGNITLHLDTGWSYDINRKWTLLQFENSDLQLLLDHSNQRAVLCPKFVSGRVEDFLHDKKEITLDKDNILLFENVSMPRLSRHYMGVFVDYAIACINRNVNKVSTEKIHRLLLTSNTSS